MIGQIQNPLNLLFKVITCCVFMLCLYFLLLTCDHQCASTLDNIEDWKWKLTMLMRNEDEQEVVSRERKDRRDFDQLSALATRMGLYRYLMFPQNICIISPFLVIYFAFWNLFLFGSRQYARVVVISKVPLPNYRSDLDHKRPQREVLSYFHCLVVVLLEWRIFFFWFLWSIII